MTYGERRKRADSKLIQRDFDELESAFLTYAQRLNEKRQAQLKKRIEKMLPALFKAYAEGNTEEVEGQLQSLKMPSSKEWRKGLEKLVRSSTEAGILRAYTEVQKIKELNNFSSEDSWNVVPEGYKNEVVLPDTALQFIRDHSYELGVITEDTAIRRIRKELEQGLEDGVSPQEMTDRINKVTDTWVSEFHAQTIARTETGKFYNAGRVASWSAPEGGGFIEAMQYDAILDTRTTDFCSHADGLIVAITNSAKIAEYTPPNHFQCRATWLPISRYEEWEDNFNIGVEKEKGFTFTNAVPFILEGQTQPLVQTVATPPVLTAKDIETHEDAREWGRQNDIEVDMGTEIDLTLARLAIDSTERVLEKIPDLKNYLTNISSKTQDGTKWGNRVYAHAWVKTRGVSLNPAQYGSLKSLYQSYRNDLQSKFHPENTRGNSIMTHELGHIVDYYLRSEGFTSSKTKRDPFGFPSKDMRTRVLRKTGVKVKDLTNELSKYGTTNPQEFFAEAFCEWMDSPNPRPVAVAVGEEVMKMVKEIEGRKK